MLLRRLQPFAARPPLADTPATGTQPAAAKADKPQEKLVCRFVNSTASRFSRERQCKTREQWEYEEDATHDDLEHGLGRATGDPGNGPH